MSPQLRTSTGASWGWCVTEPCPQGARLGWGAGHHVIDLVPGPAGLLHYGFEVRDADGVEGIRERLTSAGLVVTDLRPPTSTLRSATPWGSASTTGICVHDPDGTDVHFHSAVQRQGENTADTTRRPAKFQHTALATADLAAMVDFFVGVVGFRISDQLADGRFCWLRSSKDHHTLAVVDTGVTGELDHYSYDLSEWDDFKAWCDRLTELDVDVEWDRAVTGPATISSSSSTTP